MKKKIKRNNIKVPAYTGGTPSTSSSTTTSSSTKTGGSTPGANGSGAGDGLTAAQVGAIGQGVAAAGGMLANSFFGTSTATTGNQVAAQTAGNIFSGIGQGASIGAAFGPWGAAIGGAAGAVLGSIGQKGEKAKATTFTDYDEGTLGTGIIGAFGNRGLRREQRRIKQNAYANRAAVEGTENLAYEFAQENTMGGVNSFKDGGQVKQPVYMSSPYDFMGGGQEIATDTKEVGYDRRTGEVKINPAYGKEGSDLIHRIGKPGEYWFGKLINPATGNKFKEDAKAIVDKYHVGGNRAKLQDARTANENHKNMMLDMDMLAEAQRKQQAAQNTKPKVKRSVLAGANGMQVPAYDNGLTPYSYNTDITQFKYWDKEKNDYTEEYKEWVNNLTQQDVDDIVAGKYGDMQTYLKANPNFKMDVATARRLMTDKKYGDWHKFSQNYVDAKVTEKKPGVTLEDIAGLYPNVTPWDEDALSKALSEVNLDAVIPADIKPYDGDRTKDWNKLLRKEKWSDAIGDWGDALAQIGTLLPQIFAKPDKEKAYHNPSWNPSRNALLSTINNDEIVNQALLEQGKQRSISNYNLARTSANTGRNLGAMTQTAVNAANAIVDARIKQKLANDQALQAYSDMMNDYGKQYQAEEVRVSEANAANVASAYMTKMQGIKDAYTRMYGKRKNVKQEEQQQELYDVWKKTFGAYYA